MRKTLHKLNKRQRRSLQTHSDVHKSVAYKHQQQFFVCVKMNIHRNLWQVADTYAENVPESALAEASLVHNVRKYQREGNQLKPALN